MKIVAIIPARLASTRLNKKVLLPLGGKVILDWVYDAAIGTGSFAEVIVATDHESISDHCYARQMKCILTSDAHVSGTDRVAEIAQSLDADVFINIQADEPFIEKETILSLVNLLKRDDVQVGTLMSKMTDADALFDHNVVKVVCDVNDKAMYFSRQAIPAHRDLPYREWFSQSNYYQHLGLYGFKRSALLKASSLSIHPIESSEKLEQLRWLLNGLPIHAVEVITSSFGIDTVKDYNKALERFEMK